VNFPLNARKFFSGMVARANRWHGLSDFDI